MVDEGTPSQHVWNLLESVMDPEIPTVSVVDLGIIRGVTVDNKKLKIIITPTYSGCPAMHTIEEDIKSIFSHQGYDVTIEVQYSPPWTTDWMSEKGKIALKACGIAPPSGMSDRTLVKFPWEKKTKAFINCPRCNSSHTELKSEFGSTACKALYYCNECQQPFDYFKAF